MLDFILKKKSQKAVIIGATSGDTGSAAINGCYQCDLAKIFILHPKGLISEIQRRQMTSFNSPNVYNLALNGNYDQCQEIVKLMLNDNDFLPDQRLLLPVNSINWLRIIGQIIYYFYLSLRMGAPSIKVKYVVPTGNFGDIFAGFIAYKMGLPIGKLIIATNQNDILDRFIKNNAYQRATLQKTLSPSMDIQVSSNFERLLFEYHGRNGQIIADKMAQFKATGSLSVATNILSQIKQIFLSASANDQQIISEMQNIYQQSNYLIDPHTATATHAYQQVKAQLTGPTIALATAHPAKFPEALAAAKLTLPAMPDKLAQLEQLPEFYDSLPAELVAVKNYISQKLS